MAPDVIEDDRSVAVSSGPRRPEPWSGRGDVIFEKQWRAGRVCLEPHPPALVFALFKIVGKV